MHVGTGSLGVGGGDGGRRLTCLLLRLAYGDLEGVPRHPPRPPHQPAPGASAPPCA